MRLLVPLSADKEMSSFCNEIQHRHRSGQIQCMYENLLHFEWNFRRKRKREEEISREALHWGNRDNVIEQGIFCSAWKTWVQMRNGHFKEIIAYKRVRLERGTWEQWICAERDIVPLIEDTVVSHILPSAQNNRFLRRYLPERTSDDNSRQFFFIRHSPTREFFWFNIFPGIKTSLGIEPTTNFQHWWNLNQQTLIIHKLRSISQFLIGFQIYECLKILLPYYINSFLASFLWSKKNNCIV